MGKSEILREYTGPARPVLAELPLGLLRRRPRRFAEWNALRRWGKLPTWEPEPVGYLMRLARERAGLTQSELARRLECTQQAVAQAERWQGNPTAEFMRRWASACGGRLEVEIYTPERKTELLLANTTSRADRRAAEKDVRKIGLDPPKVRTGPRKR